MRSRRDNVVALNKRNPDWWDIFGAMALETCFNFAIACRHGSDWLVVYAGQCETPHKLTTVCFDSNCAFGQRKMIVDGEVHVTHNSSTRLKFIIVIIGTVDVACDR